MEVLGGEVSLTLTGRGSPPKLRAILFLASQDIERKTPLTRSNSPGICLDVNFQ